MTRAELQQVRDALYHAPGCSATYHEVCSCGAGAARQLLDAELARPEAREWRVVYKTYSDSSEWQVPGVFTDEAKMRDCVDSLGPCFSKRIESCTKGPWEPAE